MTTATQSIPALPAHLDRRGNGLGICLTSDRHGRPIAYRIYRDRPIRIGRIEAEHLVATEQARPLTRAQAGLRQAVSR